jgi:hypothetical protein
MGWLNFGGKKRDRAQGFGDSSKTKSRKRPKSFILEKIVTPSAGFGDWEHEFDHLHQLLGSFSLSDLHLPNFFADGGVCPIDPSGAPTNNLPPLIDFDPLGLYHDGIATQTPYNPGGAFETLPIALIPVDPHSPNPNNPNAIRQLLDFPLASQPLVGSIDTGVSADSPYLNYANIKKGRDYVGGDDNPLLKPGEGSEHGTFMLGIVDAINKSAPKWVGRAIDSGRWADSLVEFVDAAKASGQKNAIANLSLDLTQKNADGSVTTRYELTPAERSAIEYARQNGVMLVAAAGNDGGVMSVLGQASQEFDNIFTVGAGDINGRSNYSSYGRGLDIVADGGTTEHPGLSTVGNDLGTMAGTSVATAKVAGAASLVWAANPALNYRQVMEILKSTARDLGPSGWDDETGFGFLNTLAAVDLAKKTMPEVYRPTPWVTPGTWSGEGKVTPEERAAKGGNSIAAATVQVSTNFSDSDRVDGSQPDKYYQFTVNEPGYVRWNLTSLNPVSGFPDPPQVTIIKADGKPGSHIFSKGISLSSSVRTEGQTSFSGGDFYDPGTYYLRVGNGAGSSFKDYNISTQFITDKVSSFTGNIQYRTQPYYSLDNSLQSAVFSGSAVSELSNLSGVVTYDNIQFNNRIAKYGVEVNESGKIRINLNSPNGKMEVSVKKFIGSDDRPESIASLEVSANSDGWLELDLNKGRYDIEVKTPSDYWQEPDWNSTQQRLVRPYTLNATFTPNAPQPGQGKVPSSAGAFDKTVVSNGVVNHYYKNGYLTVQPSGQVSWYGYPSGVVSISVQPLNDPVPLVDPDGNYSIQTAANVLLPSGGADLGDGVNSDQVEIGYILSSIGGKDLNDFYKFSFDSLKLVNFYLSQSGTAAQWWLFQDRNGNGQVDPGEAIKTGTLTTKPLDLDVILGAGDYYLQVGSLSYDATSVYTVNVTARSLENQVIASYNSDYYLVQNGQLRLIPNQETLTAMGIAANTVKTFSNQDLTLIPLGQALPSRKDGDVFADLSGNNIYLMESGKRRLLPKGYTLKELGINLPGSPTFPDSDFKDIPLGDPYTPPIPQWQKDIDNTYQYTRNLLGNPTTDYLQTGSSAMGTQGYGRKYDHGTVYWTPQSGAIAVWYAFADTYNENGGYSGWLGFPTKANENWKDGQRIDFEGGYIYWTAQDGAKAYHFNESPSLDKTVGYDGTNTHPTYVNTFNNNGGSSALGFATGNVHPAGTGNGYLQEFSGGSEGSGAIMKSGANDNSFWVGSDFWNAYIQTGGVTGVLGYPISNRYEFNGGWKQDFQGGSLSTTLPLNPAPNSGGNTSSPQAPEIINRNGESGTGKLIQGMNFRNYPWLDSSTLVQGMPIGTTFTILEKVTTTADPTLTHSDWYRVRLNDGREGYFWAGEEFIQKVASGGSAGPIGVGEIGVTPIKEGPIGVGGIGVTPIDNSNDNTPVFPSISITSAYDANDGDTFVVAGSKVIVIGKTNSQNIRFYLGDIPLTQGNINFDNDNFSATLIIPPGVAPGSYQVKAVVNSLTGDATSSGSLINVQETKKSLDDSGNNINVNQRKIAFDNLVSTSNIKNSWGQILPDYSTDSANKSGILIDNDSFTSEENLDKSIRIKMTMFNSSVNDAIVEVYDSNGHLGDVKIISGYEPPTGLLKPAYELISVLNSKYPLGDVRRTLESKEVEVTIPEGGMVKISRSSKFAIAYNSILLALEFSQLEPLSKNELVKKTILDFLKEFLLDLIKDSTINFFKSEPTAQAILSFDFIDGQKVGGLLAKLFNYSLNLQQENNPIVEALKDYSVDTGEEITQSMILNTLLPGLGTTLGKVKEIEDRTNLLSRSLDLYHAIVLENSGIITLSNVNS